MANEHENKGDGKQIKANIDPEKQSKDKDAEKKKLEKSTKKG